MLGLGLIVERLSYISVLKPIGARQHENDELGVSETQIEPNPSAPYASVAALLA